MAPLFVADEVTVDEPGLELGDSVETAHVGLSVVGALELVTADGGSVS